MQKHTTMKHLCITVLFLGCLKVSMAQKAYKAADYKKHPYWIEMMKDPQVNYFEAVKAYELFWQDKPKPIEEDDILGQDKKADDKYVSRREVRERRKEKEIREKYGLDCKKFEHWKMQVKPYVQEDGHILSKEEQLRLWEAQRKQP